MIKYYLLTLLFLLSIPPALGQGECDNSLAAWKGEQGKLAICYRGAIHLEEEIAFLTAISGAGRFSNGNWIISSQEDAVVVLYDKAGKQVKLLGEEGSGPFEYKTPASIYIENDLAYVWASQNKKFIVYDKNGEPVREIDGFSKSIEDFIYSQEKIITLKAGGFMTDIISVYSSEGVALRSMAHSTIGHAALSILAGGDHLMALEDENTLYYILNDELRLRELNVNTGAEEVYEFADEDFTVEKKFKSIEDINDAIGSREIIPFLYENSRVTGVFNLTDYRLVTTENGKMFYRKANKVETFDDSRRTSKFIALNKQNEKLDEWVLNAEQRKKYGAEIEWSEGNVFYSIGIVESEDGGEIKRLLHTFEVVGL